MKIINKDEYDGFTLDIQIYKNYGEGYWAQAHYLVHGIDDVLWTNDIREVVNYIKSELENAEKTS